MKTDTTTAGEALRDDSAPRDSEATPREQGSRVAPSRDARDPAATATVDRVRESFVQLWGSLGTFWGVSPTTARVFGWLLSRVDPADAEEIMEGLELSRGAVSMACRELRDWGLIHPERVAGSRRVVYRAESDLEKITRHVVQIRKQREWDPILESLRDWIPELERDTSPDALVLRERLQSIATLVGLADSVVDVFLRGGTVSNVALRYLVKSASPKQGKKTRRKSPGEADDLALGEEKDSP